MKYGFLYQHYNDVGYLLYALQNYPYKKINEYDGTGTTVFSVNDDVFMLTRNPDLIATCDKKILLCHNDWDYYPNKDDFDKIIINFAGESVQTHVTDNRLRTFMDAGNICISSCNVLFSHPGYIFDISFNLIYFYYWFGYNYLNFHKNETKKTNLLGTYYNPIHISGRPSTYRAEVISRVQSSLQDDLYIYKKNISPITPITEPYHYFGFWEKNHISSYTDVVTSACTLVFETIETREDADVREHITEKTLKAIMFSEVDSFTLWYGSNKQLKYLTEKGFWFLNFEFYDETSNEEFKLRKSIVDASNYLKELKSNLGTDDEVHKYLMKTYGHKLKQNTERFKHLLISCEKTQDILLRIKN